MRKLVLPQLAKPVISETLMEPIIERKYLSTGKEE